MAKGHHMYAEAAVNTITSRPRPKKAAEAVRLRLHQPILVVEHQKSTRELIRDHLSNTGYRVSTASTCAIAEELWQTTLPDLVIIDCTMPDGGGLELIPRFKKLDPSVRLIALTGYGSLDRSWEAIKLGAEQFLVKPIDPSALSCSVERALADQRNWRNQEARKVDPTQDSLNLFLGESDAIRRLADEASLAARPHSAVLIEGELGTGKKWLAEWLHRNSPQRLEPFVELNCAAVATEWTDFLSFKGNTSHSLGEGRLAVADLAHRGTLFVSNVERADLQVQSRLQGMLHRSRTVRFPQGQIGDPRIIVASRESISRVASKKRVVRDIYSQSGRHYLAIPALRDRAEDIPRLATAMLDRLGAELGKGRVELTRTAAEALQRHPWPGNLRELRNVLEHALLLNESGVLSETQLFVGAGTSEEAPRSKVEQTLEELRRRHIEQVFRAEGGRVDAAAKRLGMPRSSLYHKLKQYQIDRFGIRHLTALQSALAADRR